MASAPLQKLSDKAEESVEERFQRLAIVWRDVAPAHPCNPVSYEHPVYKEIIGLGAAVVPSLLQAIRAYPRDWYWALYVITGATPATAQERDNFGGLNDAWLRWGKQHGYLVDDAIAGNGTNKAGTRNLPNHETPDVAQEERFEQLVAIWRAETCYLSSSTAIVNHPAYRAIIDMGAPVVPLILRELARRPAHWFNALRELTGAQPPIEIADRGKIQRIAEAWLHWGSANGYTW